MLQLPKVIGHRGAMAYAPENTLESFREAQRRGASWVEIDVKLTADGVPIVLHDSSLKRTTGVDRLVDFNCTSTLEKGFCFAVEGRACELETRRSRLLNLLPP